MVLDACVLVPIALADTLLHRGKGSLPPPLWSERILRSPGSHLRPGQAAGLKSLAGRTETRLMLHLYAQTASGRVLRSVTKGALGAILGLGNDGLCGDGFARSLRIPPGRFAGANVSKGRHPLNYIGSRCSLNSGRGKQIP